MCCRFTWRCINRRNSLKDQYAGDISDYLKFAFLRAIAKDDRRLGVAWYYHTQHDGKTDGQHIEYKNEPKWKKLDERVYNQLTAMINPNVAKLQRLNFWPKHTVFHREILVGKHHAEWRRGMTDAMGEAEIVFLDPDNGFGRNDKKHATSEDLKDLLDRKNRAIAIIKFPGHKRHLDQIQELHHCLRDVKLFNPVTVNTCVSVPIGATARRVVPRHRFFTIAGADQEVRRRAKAFAARLNALDGVLRVSARFIER
jgi:hypothetical protein